MKISKKTIFVVAAILVVVVGIYIFNRPDSSEGKNGTEQRSSRAAVKKATDNGGYFIPTPVEGYYDSPDDENYVSDNTGTHTSDPVTVTVNTPTTPATNDPGYSTPKKTTTTEKKFCTHCAGHPGKCRTCGGRGTYIPYIGADRRQCNICGGSGRCRWCNGTGYR